MYAYVHLCTYFWPDERQATPRDAVSRFADGESS